MSRNIRFLNSLSTLKLLNEESFNNLNNFNRTTNLSPLEFVIDILKYLGNGVFLKENFNRLFNSLLGNIERELSNIIESFFVREFLCKNNNLIKTQYNIPIYEIDLFDVLKYDEIKFKRKYSDPINVSIWDVVNNQTPITTNNINYSFNTSFSIEGNNYPNVLSLQLTNVNNVFGFLSNFLSTINIFNEKSVLEDLISITFNDVNEKELSILSKFKNLKKIQNTFINNSYYVLNENRQLSFKDKVIYQNTITTDDYPSSLRELTSDNIDTSDVFNILLQSLNSVNLTKNEHVIKKLFDNLSLALSKNVLNPSIMLLYNLFKHDQSFSTNENQLILNNKNFLKEILLNVVERTIVNFFLDIIISEVSDLALNNIQKNIQEKIDIYILQYRSLLKIV